MFKLLYSCNLVFIVAFVNTYGERVFKAIFYLCILSVYRIESLRSIGMPDFKSAEKRLLACVGKDFSIKKVSLNGFDLNYIESSSENKKTLLLLHGANLGWGQWCSNLDVLSEEFHVIAIDLPGAGGSTGIDYSKSSLDKTFLNTLLEFIEYKNISGCHVMTHSFSGWLVLRALLNKKDLFNKVILVSPMGFTKKVPFKYFMLGSKATSRLISKTAMKPTFKNMRDFLGSAFFKPEKLSNELADYYHKSVVQDSGSHPFDFITRVSGFFFVRKGVNLLRELRSLDKDILVIGGKKDSIISSKDLEKGVEQSHSKIKLKMFSESGHVPFSEEIDEFNDLCIEYLNN